MVDLKYKYRGVAVQAIAHWVYGNIIEEHCDITERTKYYIITNRDRVEVKCETICRRVYYDGNLEVFDKDIVEFDYLNFDNKTYKRVEEIIDRGTVVYVGTYHYAFKMFDEVDINIRVAGNMIDCPDLLKRPMLEIK